MKCKFCGKEIKTEKYLNPEKVGRSCGGCTRYCMEKCEIASNPSRSWHKPPCIECEHNPYKHNHIYNGERWVNNG